MKVKILNENFGLRVVGLCDYNPYGYKLLLNYLHGSGINGSPEAYKFVVPSLSIIGMRAGE